MRVESVKGECNLGQHEITFRYTDLVAKGDEHVLFKTGAKEIAAQEGCSLTFMAKYDAREGSSCHIHISLRDDSGQPLFAGDGHNGFSAVFEQFMAGLLATLRDLTLFVAPNINSYKRFVPGSFAPTALAWGHDNRSCALRVVGHEPTSLRVECRVPGADVNPYLALAAIVAGGLYGIEEGLELEPEFMGNAYNSDKPRLPTTLREAADLFSASAVTRKAFGDEVVDHYANMARRRARGIRVGCNGLGALSGIRAPVSSERAVVNPANEEIIKTISPLDAEAIDEAIARSAAVAPSWRVVAPADRARLLRRFAEAVDRANEELARLEVANSGHTISNARWEAGNVRDVLAYYAGSPERLTGRQIPVPGGVDVTFREPIGVVGVIVPWNFPMPIASWGFGPALAAGNTVVLKPADLTPLTAIRIGELALEAGIPEDVFQVLPGRGQWSAGALSPILR